MNDGTNVIDAALRFARSNPDLVACAREGALQSGRSVDDLLLDAVERMRAVASKSEGVAPQRAGPSYADCRLDDRELAAQRRYRKRSVAASRRTDSSANS